MTFTDTEASAMTDHAYEIAHDTEFYRLLLDQYAAADTVSREASYVVEHASDEPESYSFSPRRYRTEEAAFDALPLGTVYRWEGGGFGKNEYRVVREPRTIGERTVHMHHAATARDALAVLPADNKYVVRYTEALAALHAARDAVDAHDAAGYTGWTRFMLCTSSNGHVHRDTHCSTCGPRTRFAPVVSLSGADDVEAIATLGETLCSVCYPDAPVTGKIGKLNKTAVKRLLAADAR